MQTKTTYNFLNTLLRVFSFLLLGNFTFGQGSITMYNDGATITQNVGGTLTLFDANFTNQTNGANHGSFGNAGTVQLQGDWTNNVTNVAATGTTDPTIGNVIFFGVIDQAITTGTIATEEFFNLTLSNTKGNGIITMNDHVTVNNILSFTTNNFIDINTNNLTIPNWVAGDITGYGSDRFIIVDNTGFVKTTGVNSGETVNFPIGISISSFDYAYAEIANADAANTSFDANVCDYVNNLGTCSGGIEAITNVVDYTWNFVSSSTNATVKVQWWPTKQLGAFNPTLCSVMHHDGATWNNLTAYAAQTNEAGGYKSRTGPTTSFSPFTVADDTEPLPIELVSFEAKTINTEVVLSWTTASESNNNYFVVERSQDGVSFEELDRVDGAGNSQTRLDYIYTDFENIDVPTIYYRLTQVDYDGKSESFQVVAIDNSEIETTENNLNAILYPNPVANGGLVSLKFNKDVEETTVLIVVVDVMGNQHYMKADYICCDSYILNTDGLVAGVYYIVASQNDNLISTKLVVQ